LNSTSRSQTRPLFPPAAGVERLRRSIETSLAPCSITLADPGSAAPSADPSVDPSHARPIRLSLDVFEAAQRPLGPSHEAAAAALVPAAWEYA
jgi:hypothetical protein